MDTLRWILLLVGVAVVAGVYLWTRRQARGERDTLPLDLGRIDDSPLERPHDAAAEDAELQAELSRLQAIITEAPEEAPASAPERPAEHSPEPPRRETPPQRASTPPAATPDTPAPESPPRPQAQPAAPSAGPAEGPASSGGADAPEPAAARAGHGPQPTAAPRPPAADDKLVALFVVARQGRRFTGPEVAQALAEAGLQFGAMDIFHRFPGADTSREPVFSVANLVNPGTFDPDAMDQFTTPGLSLFMRLPGPVDGPRAFDDLIASARRIADNLDGELRDQTRSILSRQTVEALREEVVEYERRVRIHHA
ncbi:MAG TPA: cell division protein ZipA [Gammaproteobacteria bacterium]|nr:cell division protein ZipA [Gammaproteobacteria bacterium]